MRDVVVVGAGPAGGFLSTLLARQGLDVMLVDRDRFPRWTVCGACLSGTGVGQLRAEGMEQVLDDAGAPALTGLELRGWGRRAELGLFGGRVLSRRALDAALIEVAEGSGAEVHTRTRARLGRWTGQGREVELTGPDGSSRRVRTRVVVAATGLHPLPRLPGVEGDAALQYVEGSRVGVGAVVTDWGDGPPPGIVRMCVGSGGYVGQVLQEDGSWVIAGALDPVWLRKHGGPGSAVEALVTAEGGSGDWTLQEGWRGTPALTRRRTRCAEPGVFYLGDAAGYVEPFTGEGMGWALRGARELEGLAAQAVSGWAPELMERWDRRYRARVGSLQRLCRGVAWLGRRPALARRTVAVLSRAPWLARPALRRLADSASRADGKPAATPRPRGIEPPASPTRL